MARRKMPENALTARFVVCSGGISGYRETEAGNQFESYSKGEIVTGAQIGDSQRITKLIERGSLTVTQDDAEGDD